MTRLEQVDRIKFLAKEKGIKIKYICARLGLSETYLANVRNGRDRMTEERLEIIAKILETTPEYLNGLTDNPSPRPSADPPTHTIVIPARNGRTVYRQLTPEQWEKYNKLIEIAMPEILDDSDEDF